MKLPLKSLLLLSLSSLHCASAETVLGVYIFSRHGDRTTKSYSPVTLTALGAEQVFKSGSYYRDQYVSSDAKTRIHGLSSDVAVLSQLDTTSPIDAVLQNSAQVFLQGLYPPAGSASAQALANGSKVESPLDGYQYIPVNAVSTAASSGGSEENEWLQAGSGCGNAILSSNNFFVSDEFTSTLESTKSFYQRLLPVIEGTFDKDEATFKNAYTIFDFIHVSTIYNKTIPSSSLLTDPTLHQLQTRADQHQWGLAYNSSEEIRAIAGSVLGGQILQALNDTLRSPPSKASAQRLTIQFGAYGTFMAFFGLADAPAASPDFYGVADYASTMVFELVTNATVADDPVDPSDVSVRFRFANGTADADTNPARAFALFGQDKTVLPWSDFASAMNRFAIGDTASWCRACGNSSDAGCAAALGNDDGDAGAAGEGGSDGGGGGGVSRPVAGVIGALVTLVVVLGIEALVMGVGGLRLVKKSVLSDKSGGAEGAPGVAQA